MQRNDVTINKLENANKYITEDDIKYKLKFNKNEEIISKQLVIPKVLRRPVMELVHDSKMSGNLGIKKTQDRVCGSFYWSGIYSDVKRYCKSCDVCQRTVHKGSVSPVPLGKMPLIDVPCKRVAIDLIGPINPTTNEGHRYILTIVDYATRSPEAVALKGCTLRKKRGTN